MKLLITKQVLKNLKGEPLKDGNSEDKLTIGAVLAFVLCGRVNNPERAFRLAKKISTEDKVDLQAEDVVFIKAELENNAKQPTGFNALIIGQIIDILESSDTELAKKKK